MLGLVSARHPQTASPSRGDGLRERQGSERCRSFSGVTAKKTLRDRCENYLRCCAPTSWSRKCI